MYTTINFKTKKQLKEALATGGNPYWAFDEDEMVAIVTIIRSWLETFEDEDQYPPSEYIGLWEDIAHAHTLLRDLGVK